MVRVTPRRRRGGRGRGSIFSTPPASEALGQQLAENTPLGPWAQPVLVAQGLADELALPEMQSRFVAACCQAGRVIDYRRYAGCDHLSVVAGDSPLVGELVAWTQQRFVDALAEGVCGQR